MSKEMVFPQALSHLFKKERKKGLQAFKGQNSIKISRHKTLKFPVKILKCSQIASKSMNFIGLTCFIFVS